MYFIVVFINTYIYCITIVWTHCRRLVQIIENLIYVQTWIFIIMSISTGRVLITVGVYVGIHETTA